MSWHFKFIVSNDVKFEHGVSQHDGFPSNHRFHYYNGLLLDDLDLEYPHFRKPPYNCQQHVDNMLVKNPGNKNRTGNNGGF